MELIENILIGLIYGVGAFIIFIIACAVGVVLFSAIDIAMGV